MSDIDLDAIKRRWHTHHGRSAEDYTDAGCRVLAKHAFVDVPALISAVRERDERIAVLEMAGQVLRHEFIYETCHEPIVRQWPPDNSEAIDCGDCERCKSIAIYEAVANGTVKTSDEWDSFIDTQMTTKEDATAKAESWQRMPDPYEKGKKQ